MNSATCFLIIFTPTLWLKTYFDYRKSNHCISQSSFCLLHSCLLIIKNSHYKMLILFMQNRMKKKCSMKKKSYYIIQYQFSEWIKKFIKKEILNLYEPTLQPPQSFKIVLAWSITSFGNCPVCIKGGKVTQASTYQK